MRFRSTVDKGVCGNKCGKVKSLGNLELIVQTSPRNNILWEKLLIRFQENTTLLLDPESTHTWKPCFSKEYTEVETK